MHEISDLTHSSNKVREVVDRIAKILDEHTAGNRTAEISAYKTREEVDNSGWAVSTLDAALWAFNTTASFERLGHDRRGLRTDRGRVLRLRCDTRTLGQGGQNLEGC